MPVEERPVDHQAEMFTMLFYCLDWLGLEPDGNPGPVLWLIIPGQKLRIITAGAVLRDESGDLSALWVRLVYYPLDTWLAILPGGILYNGLMLRFIGGLQFNPVANDHSLVADMLARLPGEVGQAKGLAPDQITRFVGFESAGDFPEKIRFFGIEVDEIRYIPKGLVSWELDADSFAVRQSDEGRPCPSWWEDISWAWSVRPHENSGRIIGEFNGRGMPAWWTSELAAIRPFRLFAHAFYDLKKNAFDDEVFLVDYDPSWPDQYEEMATWLKAQLGPDIALRLAHYGSTAIPGIPAKPIIDILVEIPSFSAGKERALTVMNDPSWEFWCYAGHMVFFKREECMGRRTHHVHLAPAGHQLWQGLAFRDYLIAHPDDAVRYARLKRELARSYRNDRERYTQKKTQFVEQINQMALKETRPPADAN